MQHLCTVCGGTRHWCYTNVKKHSISPHPPGFQSKRVIYQGVGMCASGCKGTPVWSKNLARRPSAIQWGHTLIQLCHIFIKFSFIKVGAGWWFLELQIIYQSATHLHQLLEPNTNPRNYSAAQKSRLINLANSHDMAVCIQYYLDVKRVIQLSGKQWEWIWRRFYDLCMCAIYSTTDIWQSNYSKSTLNL